MTWEEKRTELEQKIQQCEEAARTDSALLGQLADAKEKLALHCSEAQQEWLMAAGTIQEVIDLREQLGDEERLLKSYTAQLRIMDGMMPRSRAEQIYCKMIAICERHRETTWIQKAAELSYDCGKMLSGGSCDSRSQWRVEQLQRAAWLLMRASQKYGELVKENPTLLPPLAQACFDAAVLLEKLHLSGPANGAWQHCLEALVKIREHQKTSCDDAARFLEGGLQAVLSGCMRNADRMLHNGCIQESAALREALAKLEGCAEPQGQPG